MKKVILIIFIILIISFIIVSIFFANISNNNFEIIYEKAYYEIKYLDSKIINISNLFYTTNIDWDRAILDVKILYNYWNNTILDLSNLNIDKNVLTEFGKNLDLLTISIKNMDKQECLKNLVNLYEKIIFYYDNIEYNQERRIINYSKYNLLVAYSIVEKGNWTLTYESILKSDSYLYNIINSITDNVYMQYNVNQAYIAIKELENIINIQDIDIFYIKYSIAMKKLNSI